MSYFYSLEVAGRGSESQIQVSENVNNIYNLVRKEVCACHFHHILIPYTRA